MTRYTERQLSCGRFVNYPMLPLVVCGMLSRTTTHRGMGYVRCLNLWLSIVNTIPANRSSRLLSTENIMDMKNIEKRIAVSLANGAEYLAMGEIAANTGLLVSQAPRNNANYDIIVNNYDLSKGCRVEVKHSRSGFKANISGNEYDFLVFVYAPSEINNGRVIPTSKREIYVFPQSVVEASPKGKTGENFNPKHVDVYENYRDAFDLILGALT